LVVYIVVFAEFVISIVTALTRYVDGREIVEELPYLFSCHLSSIDSIQASKEKQWLATTTEWRIDFALHFLSEEEHKNVSACFYLPHPRDVKPQLGVHVVLSGSRGLLVSLSRIHFHCYL